MSDRNLHFWALGLISLAFVAKVISLILIGELHVNIKFLEFISIAVYFFYIGYLGFARREFREENGKYMVYATIIVALDILTYYLFKGWN